MTDEFEDDDQGSYNACGPAPRYWWLSCIVLILIFVWFYARHKHGYSSALTKDSQHLPTHTEDVQPGYEDAAPGT